MSVISGGAERGMVMTDIKSVVLYMPRDAAYCDADWRRLLGAAYGSFAPFFEPVAGRVTGTYPDKTGNFKYEVRRHGDGWLGMPSDRVAESEDSPWPVLKIEDVRLWRLNESGWKMATKLAGMAEEGEAGGQRTGNGVPDGGADKVRIIGDYTTIRIGKREINLARKYKARDVLRYLHERLKGIDGVFCFEEVKEDYNSQFSKGAEKRKWKSDRFREDLFRGLDKDEFDCLFETLDQAAGRYRLKI